MREIIPTNNSGLKDLLQQFSNNLLYTDDSGKISTYESALKTLEESNKQSSTALQAMGFTYASLMERAVKRTEDEVAEDDSVSS